jgi:predicted TIM-barrel fold metal-dependent hydrolase
MRNGFRIIDADRHVIEPVEMWREYLDPAFRDAVPYLASTGSSPFPVLMVLGQPVMSPIPERAQIELARTQQRRAEHVAAASRPEGQLRAMDEAGIDVAFLFPTFASYLVSVDTMSPELAGAFAEAYNRWLYDYCRVAPERLRGVGLMSLHDPASLVEQVERAAGLGWKAVVLRPNPVKGRHLAHPELEPFWSACERNGMAVAIHEGTHARLPTAGADRFATRFGQHACSHPMEQMMALLALVEGGVLERHPRLRVAFLEAGCGWLPYWLWRLDEVEYRHLAGEVGENVRVKPSEYFRRQCFVSAEPDEAMVAEYVRQLGEDRVLFGTDFPHLDHEGDVVGQIVEWRGEMGDALVRNWLGNSAERFYLMSWM